MQTGVKMKYCFPNSDMEMAKLRFEVELSSAQNIKWGETQKGLLDFFAMCSHDTYLKLTEVLNEKCGDRLFQLTAGEISDIANKLHTEKVMAHFGYDSASVAPAHGFWPNDGTVLEQLGKLPEVLKMCGADKRKIRIAFDYDPDFPRAVLQIWGLQQATLPPDKGSLEERPGK